MSEVTREDMAKLEVKLDKIVDITTDIRIKQAELTPTVIENKEDIKILRKEVIAIRKDVDKNSGTTARANKIFWGALTLTAVLIGKDIYRILFGA